MYFLFGQLHVYLHLYKDFKSNFAAINSGFFLYFQAAPLLKADYLFSCFLRKMGNVKDILWI